MYGLSEKDLQIQARARGFADELIPLEDEAERAHGELPADVTAAHAKRARELAGPGLDLQIFFRQPVHPAVPPGASSALAALY